MECVLFMKYSMRQRSSSHLLSSDYKACAYNQGVLILEYFVLLENQ